MNVVDLIIILPVLLAIERGIRVGLLRLFFTSVGFLAGLLLGSFIASQAAVHISNPAHKIVALLLIELVSALVLSTIGDRVSLYLRRGAERLHLGNVNKLLGATFEVLFTLFVVWLLASALSNVQSYGLGQQVASSRIITILNKSLPPPPDVLAELEKIVSPNGFPKVFVGNEPQHVTAAPNTHVDNAQIMADEKSVVKIVGAGCGGVVEGSGFVVANGVVVTDAHVIAGIDRPKVQDQKKTYEATPIWFDKNNDVALLEVDGLGDPPLTLNTHILPGGSAAVVLGYPGGGPLSLEPAVVLDQITALGRNIYNRGLVSRSIYEIQANVEPGNSGGPLLDADGTVVGMVFAKAVSQNQIGYVLTINQFKSAITQALTQKTPVLTGSCTD